MYTHRIYAKDLIILLDSRSFSHVVLCWKYHLYFQASFGLWSWKIKVRDEKNGIYLREKQAEVIFIMLRRSNGYLAPFTRKKIFYSAHKIQIIFQHCAPYNYEWQWRFTIFFLLFSFFFFKKLKDASESGVFPLASNSPTFNRVKNWTVQTHHSQWRTAIRIFKILILSLLLLII
jgi:hypothetical protein